MPTPKSTQSKLLNHKVLKAPHAQRKNVKRTHNPGAKKNATARVNEQEAFAYRLQGLSYPEIGRKMGISHVGAYQMVMRVLEGIERDLEEKVPQVRQMELARLDKHVKALEPKARKGDVRAIETTLRVEHVRCRLLGLYAPEEVKHSGEITVIHQMTDAAIDLELQTLLSQVPELREIAAPPIEMARVAGTSEPAYAHVNGKVPSDE